MSSQTRLRPRFLPDGLRFGKYQIVRLIGVGGMSEVYEAVHIGLRKRVALKILRPDFAENEEARKRFVSEGVNAARIRHTNIVDVTDVGVVYQLPFLVMALLEGEDLGALFDRQGRMPVSEVVDLLLPVASAVAVGHEQGVVHRDLKPDNIFLHREGCRIIPKVLDFGVSRSMSGRRITLSASVFGTPHYMSPEQARGANTDARTDQYAIGVMLYEGVTGRLPRDSANPLELLHSVAFDAFRPPTDHVELPKELAALILRAMAHNPEDRFPTMHDLALALVPFASDAAREYWTLELNEGPKRPSVIMQPAARHTGELAQLESGAEPSSVVVLPAPPSQRRTGASRALLTSPEAAQPPAYAHITDASLHSSRSNRAAWGMLLAAAALGTTGALVFHGGHPGADAVLLPIAGSGDSWFDVEVRVEPSSAALFLDGNRIGVGHYQGRLPKNGASHELQATADGFVTEIVQFKDRPPPARIELTSSATALDSKVSVEEAVASAPTTPSPAPAARARSSLRDRSPRPELNHGPFTPALRPTEPPRPEPKPSAATPAPRASIADPARAQRPALSAPQIVVIDAAPPNSQTPAVSTIDDVRPRVRSVDEFAPRVQVVE